MGGPIPYAEDDPRRDRGLIYLSEKKREEELALKNAQKARDKKARRKKRKTTEGEEVEREEEVEEEEENEEDIPLPPLIVSWKICIANLSSLVQTAMLHHIESPVMLLSTTHNYCISAHNAFV